MKQKFNSNNQQKSYVFV